MRHLLLSLLLLSSSNLTWAKDMNGQYASFGIGARPCSDFLGARQDEDELMDYYNNFVFGYLSAFNLIVQNNFNILGERSMGSALEWLDSYCSDNNEDTFTNALASLTLAYYDERQNFVSNPDGWFGSASSATEALERSRQ